MKKHLFKLFAILMVLAMVVAPASANAVQTVPQEQEFPPRDLQKIPQEILDEFETEMTVEEFLLNNKGPIPNALMEFADKQMVVIVQMEQPSLIENMVKQGVDAKSMKAADQKSYVSALSAAQDAAASQAEALGGVVMGRYTKTYNGFMLRIAANQLNAVRALPGVVDVRRAPVYEPTLSISVPLINADDVWEMLPTGYTGEGVTVAVIDTGIDYTHKMFGGVGTAVAFDANDPNVVEPGSFPTAKVIGGYDFAGTDYDAGSDDPALLVPVPDPDPLDEGGHGTHVASTVAGVEVSGVDITTIGNGVAPDALLYAFKVFGADGSTNLVVDALEMAMDPNGDGDISDRVDVINMSLGSSMGPADVTDPEYIAVENAAAMGVFLAVSAGNSGDTTYIVGSPSVSDSAISVAASNTGYMTLPVVAYNDGSDQQIPYQPSDNTFSTAVTGVLADVDDLDGSGTGELCETTGIAADALLDQVALIQRGTCSFYIKINNAETLGAVGVIVYNNASGGDAFLSMLTSGSTLPAGFVRRTDGLTLKGLADDQSVTVGPDGEAYQFTDGLPDADTIADFSSRGPRGFDSKLKPEITAPGVGIFAAKMGSGDEGTSMNGTSMAAPHIAGVAALMKEAHPTWTVEQIKAAMMNTAVDLADAASAEVPRQGAGRVDALEAVTTDVVAVGDPKLVSLSWGEIQMGSGIYQSSKSVTLRNFGSSPVTYNTDGLFTSASVGAQIDVSVSSVNVPANSTATVVITLTLDPSLIPITFTDFDADAEDYVPVLEEYYGFVTFTNETPDPDEVLRVPFYFVPRPYTEVTEVSKDTSIDVMIPLDEAEINLQQSGPQASLLKAYPLYLTDANETAQLDAGDLRYVGMDFGWEDGTFGDIFVPAFAMWGPTHVNMPYFTEVDMTMDVDEDGVTDYVVWNSDYGLRTAGTPNNWWIPYRYNYATGTIALASVYFINADFNSGIQEWYLMASQFGMGTSNTNFAYEVYSYDYKGAEDYAGAARFDYAKAPLTFEVSPDATPVNETFSLTVAVDDLGGYIYSKPKGVLLFDYFGKPGMGQAYYWALDVTGFPILYMPIVFK